jgi:hypothetical protein
MASHRADDGDPELDRLHSYTALRLPDDVVRPGDVTDRFGGYAAPDTDHERWLAELPRGLADRASRGGGGEPEDLRPAEGAA